MFYLALSTYVSIILTALYADAIRGILAIAAIPMAIIVIVTAIRWIKKIL